MRSLYSYFLFGALLLAGIFCPRNIPAEDMDSEIEFEIVDRTEEFEQNDDVEYIIVRDHKPAEAPDLSQIIITDDPEFEIDRSRVKPKRSKNKKAGNQRKLSAEEEKYEQDMKLYNEYCREQKRPRRFLFFSYVPFDNTINGVDARLFITGVFVSLFYVVAMLMILIRELGNRTKIYTVEQMRELRSYNLVSISEKDAAILVDNLYNTYSDGKKPNGDELININNRSELSLLRTELEAVAATLPTDEESVAKLNILSDSVNFWKSRFLVTPWLNSDSGIVKRILMLILYLILVIYLYPGHPMYLLVIFCPLAFWTPAFLVEKRENSRIYRMLGGSLRTFGKITGSALDTVARSEGATVTVWRDAYGNTRRVEYNYWGTFFIFAFKIAVALLLLYLIYVCAPLIVLYGLIRNYILAR